MSLNTAKVVGLSRESASGSGVVRESGPDVIHVLGESPLVLPDGQLCGLFAVDIVGFNGWRRDDDIQMYVHKSLYEMLQTAFDRSGVPWSGCVHEDRGDGVLVIVPPTIPLAGLVAVPDRLRGLVRRHNHVSCDAAHVQLRMAVHVGPVHHDGHGFVGRDVSLLFRLLDARSLRRMLSESGADVAFIASGNMYENVIRRRPSLVDLTMFQSLSVRVKETRTRAWAYAPIPLCRGYKASAASAYVSPSADGSSRGSPRQASAEPIGARQEIRLAPRGRPGEAARLGKLAGDQAAERVGVFGGNLGIDQAVDFHRRGRPVQRATPKHLCDMFSQVGRQGSNPEPMGQE